MPFEPLNPAGNFTASPELPRPSEDEGESPGFGEALGAAFRTENTIGSLMAAQDHDFGWTSFDKDFDPWAEIADTPYEVYSENFARARNREHFAAIKADIDRENKDRDILARSGALGFAAGAGAGVLDWPTLLPGGAIVRTAKGTTSILRSAANVAASGAAGSALAEGVLQGTQQLRTAEESAAVIGGSTVLAGLLGAGLAKRVARSDFERLAPRIERDFEVPDADAPDVFEPGGLRAFHGTPHEVDQFRMDKIGTGEGGAAFGHGLYFAEAREVAQHYVDSLGELRFDMPATTLEPSAARSMARTAASQKLRGQLDSVFLRNWQGALERAQASGDQALAERAREALKIGEHIKATDVRRDGNLYEVRIDVKPEQLLDWDAPLSAHAPETQAALRGALGKALPGRGEWVDRGGDTFSLLPRGETDPDISLGTIERLEDGQWWGQSDALSRGFASLDEARAAIEAHVDRVRGASVERMTGKDIYQRLSDALGGDEAASAALRGAGVPGLRFFDEVSRRAGGGTRNIVVFDDRLVNILRKDGSEPAASGDPTAVPVAREAGSGRATSAGAAAVERADDALKSAFGLEKAMSFQDPLLRLQTSPSPVSRRYVQELAETPLTYSKNELGEPTAPIGSEMGQPGAVETRMKFWQGQLSDAIQALDDAFLKYRKGRGKKYVGEIPALTLRDTIRGTNALTYRDFKTEVSKALRRGDKHDIPEVAAAAKAIRQQALDPLKDEAIKAELLPEDVSVETAESYLNRVYNKERIIAERDQFKAVVRDWLDGQETINRGVRTRLQPLLDTLDEADEAGGKLDARLPKVEARIKDLEARADEAAKVQKLAFTRALERRQPIEALQNRIADLGAEIEGPLDALSSMRGLDSSITDARQIARAMQEDDGGDLAAQLADVAELEEGIDDIIAKAEGELDRIAERGDLPLPRVEGRIEGGPLPDDEIEEVVASWGFLRDMRARRKPEGLTSFVVRMGGVEDPGGDVLAMLGRSKDRPGLIRKGAGRGDRTLPGMAAAGDNMNSLDTMALRAWENGFFPSAQQRPTVNEFLDALREDFGGNPQVRGDDEAYFTDVERAGQIEEDLRSRGVDPAKFKKESQLRLFLGQEPRAALANEAGGALRALREVKRQLADTIEPYRARITALTREARRRERTESIRQSERGVFATQSRNRSRSIADRLFAERGKREKILLDQQANETRRTDALKAIEEEIGRYQGKSASEAKAALERRAQAERMREEKRAADEVRREELIARIRAEESALSRLAMGAQPDKARLDALEGMRQELGRIERGLGDPRRLRSADSPVLAAARGIAAQVDKEPGEISDLADQIIDRILGTPDGRLPYDAHKASAQSFGANVDARGPLAARQFMIPDVAIERWLEGDVEQLLRAYTRTMAADVEIHKRFGSVDLVDQIKEIAEDYARRAEAAATPEERKKLHKQRDADIRDLAAIRDRLRGQYALPSNPDGLLVRAGRVVSSLNYMRMLGGMTLSAIPDLGGIVFSHGISRVFGDGLFPLLRNWSGARIAMQEIKTAGTALDMVLDSRAMNIADVMDNYGRHSKFERSVQSMASNFGVVSLQAPWNAAMKQFTGLISMTRMLRAADRWAGGKATKPEIERLAASGISQRHARQIAEQFAKHGRKEGGVWFPNTGQWDDGARPAIEAFRNALVREVDRIIITPGQDKPLWMSTEIGRLVGQFKSFAISAMQRIAIAGLQQRDAATLNGAALMVALGGLVGIMKGKIAGQPTHSDWDDPRKNAAFLVDAIDRSGLTGWLMDANSMTEKLTRGAVGLSAITGKPVSRYASRNLTGSLLGPSVGTVEDALRTVGAAASGEWNQSNSRALRRLIPYNNLFYARKLFDEAEAGINGWLGVPAPGGARRPQ